MEGHDHLTVSVSACLLSTLPPTHPPLLGLDVTGCLKLRAVTRLEGFSSLLALKVSAVFSTASYSFRLSRQLFGPPILSTNVDGEFQVLLHLFLANVCAEVALLEIKLSRVRDGGWELGRFPKWLSQREGTTHLARYHVRT